MVRLATGIFITILLLSAGYIAAQIDSARQTAVSVTASYGMQIAESYAKKLDTDQMERFLQEPVESDLYWSIRAELNAFRERIGATYIYTLALDQQGHAAIMIDGLPPGSEMASAIGEETEVEPEHAALLRSGRAASSDLADDGEFGTLVTSYAPIMKPDGTVIGVLGIDTDADVINSMAAASLRNSMPIFIGMGVFTLIAVLIAGLLLYHALRPLQWITRSVELIADSKFSEAARVMERHRVRSRNEVGVMYRHVAHMSERLNGLIRHIVTNIGEASTVIAEDAAVLSHDANRLVAENAEVQQAARQAGAGTASQSAASHESARAMEEVSGTLQRIAESSLAANDASAQALESAERGRGMTVELGAQMQSIAGAADDTARRITVLQANTSRIDSAVQAITAIAAQTKILALNAAIEAARAGDHGKGFAVVSSEIHKLADSAGHAAGSIEEMLRQIERESMEIARAMQRSTTELEIGRQLSDEVENALVNIVSMFRMVSGQIQEISAGTEQLSASAEQVGASINEIAHIAQRSADQLGRIGEQTDRQHERVERVSQAAERLNQMTAKLNNTVKGVTI